MDIVFDPSNLRTHELNPLMFHDFYTQKHGSTDLHNRVFLTSTCQNASRFVIFQISNFAKRRRKVCRGFFFHLAFARYVSLGHVVAIDPLIDSIPESSIDCWASAVLHLTGATMLPTTINLLGSCNFPST